MSKHMKFILNCICNTQTFGIKKKSKGKKQTSKNDIPDLLNCKTDFGLEVVFDKRN